MRHILSYMFPFAFLVLCACGGSGGGDEVGGGGGGPLILTVTNLDSDGPGSLRQTIEDAPSGAWIVFSAELAVGDVTFDNEISIEKDVVIGGLSAAFERFSLRGTPGHRLFRVYPGASLDLRDLVIRDGDSGSVGGAIYADSGTILLARVLFLGNQAQSSGGAITLQEATLRATACAFTANGTQENGGAIRVTRFSDVLIRDTSFFLNQAGIGGGPDGYGGALSIMESDVDLVNVTIEDNQSDHGGAISVATTIVNEGTANVGIWNSTISNNEAGQSVTGGVMLHPHINGTVNAEIHRSVLTENTQFGGPLGDLTASGAGTLVAEVFNSLVHTEDVAFVQNGVNDNQTGIDAQLGTVEAHTLGRIYRRPGAASPLLDAVPASSCVGPDGSPLEADQRGEPRDFLGLTDIGSIER